MNFYNEFDPKAAAWIRNLISDGLIPKGVVDERSITEIDPAELDGYAQCHFFAGIAGWSLALELAGWSADRPVWTGSPPCQPFSTAGNRKGKDDLRHLWPVFFNLIRECKPAVVFGEQVASAIRDGWFCDLQADLEAEEYASGMVVLPACSIGAPHKRERLFYFAKRPADTCSKRLEGLGRSEQEHDQERWEESAGHCTEGRNTSPLADSDRTGQPSSSRRGEVRGNETRYDSRWSGENDSPLGNTEHNGSHGTALGRSTVEACDYNAQGSHVSSESEGAGRSEESGDICHTSDTSIGLGNTQCSRREQGASEGWPEREGRACEQAGCEVWQDASDRGAFSRTELIYCRDNKYRPIPEIKPDVLALADGLPSGMADCRDEELIPFLSGYPLTSLTVPNRAALLKGAGNAIVPQVAAEVVMAFMDSEEYFDGN